jgi:hypothetical protein
MRIAKRDNELRRSERWVICAESRFISFALHGRSGVPDTASENPQSSSEKPMRSQFLLLVAVHSHQRTRL